MTLFGGQICWGLLNPVVWGQVSVQGGYKTLTAESCMIYQGEKKNKRDFSVLYFSRMQSSKLPFSCSPSPASREPVVSAGSQLVGKRGERGGALDESLST